MKTLEEYLSGKTVALVAGGSSLVGKNLGSLIDSYDVVVRMNRALPLDPLKADDVGTRTDILYNCLDGAPDAGGPILPALWINCGVKYLCSSYPQSEFFVFPQRSTGVENFLPTRWLPDEVYYPMKEQVKGRPNSGTSTLVDLLSFNIKKVHLFGMDFHRTLYDKSYYNGGEDVVAFERHLSTNPYDRHDPDSQYMFFKNVLYKNDNRIIVEDYFKDILSDASYDKLYFKD